MEDQTEKRLRELSDRAWNRGIPCFSDFLDLSQQTLWKRMFGKSQGADLLLFGGADGCERRMAGFGVSKEEKDLFPIQCLHILPNGPRFAEALTHRDVLGALMNLGFERDQLGDIVLREKEAWLFCTRRMAPFIRENLLCIRRTPVHCEEALTPPEGELFRTERQTVQLSSLRMDALVAHVFRLSRGDAQELFPAGKIFLDGAECPSPDAAPAPGQIVSVRGYGRFRYVEEGSLSKKGKLNMTVELYV